MILAPPPALVPVSCLLAGVQLIGGITLTSAPAGTKIIPCCISRQQALKLVPACCPAIISSCHATRVLLASLA
jgi:hypothetical protein